MSWSKLDSRILHSSIWLEDDHTRLLWITMLAMADSKDRVFASIPGLASAAKIPLESCTKGLKILSDPDPHSQDPEHDGRRIQKLEPSGWIILNRKKYTGLTAEEKRRIYNQRYYSSKKKTEENRD